MPSNQVLKKDRDCQLKRQVGSVLISPASRSRVLRDALLSERSSARRKPMIVLRKILILRRVRSARLEGGMALIQPNQDTTDRFRSVSDKPTLWPARSSGF